MRSGVKYACIVFFPGGVAPKKWRFVPKLESFTQFLNKSHNSWEYINVYDKRTGHFLERIYSKNKSLLK